MFQKEEKEIEDWMKRRDEQLGAIQEMNNDIYPELGLFHKEIEQMFSLKNLQNLLSQINDGLLNTKDDRKISLLRYRKDIVERQIKEFHGIEI